MAVSKRLRYEVLRRDNYTCRYCGATAPDVKLTVDHVVPQALGGSDDPANLVAACEPCNNGKTSVPADAPVIADVEEDALRWAAAMDKAAEMARAKHEVLLDYRNVFRDAWNEWKTGSEHAKTAIPLDPNWETSLDNFYEAGLPDWELGEAVRAAMTNHKVTPSNTFRYFAGICWKKIRQMQDVARQVIDSQDEGRDGRQAEEDTVDAITERWLSAYRARCKAAGIDSSQVATERLRRTVVALLEQGFSADRVTSAAEKAGHRLTLHVAEYLDGSYGDLMFDAMATWVTAWVAVDPDGPLWRSSVPAPATWNDVRAELRNAISAGVSDVEILEACKKAGEAQQDLLAALPDWPGRWGD